MNYYNVITSISIVIFRSTPFLKSLKIKTKTSSRKILFLIMILVLVACNTESKKEYTKIKSDYNQIINSKTPYEKRLIADINFLKQRIKKYETDFPTNKHEIELTAIKQILDTRLYSIAVKELQTQYDKLELSDIIEYDSYRKALRQILFTGQKLLEEFPVGANTYEIKKIIEHIEQDEIKIIKEENSYRNLTDSYRERYSIAYANEEINEINSFLKQHLKSIKRDELESRISKLEYIKFELESEKEIKTITELNALLQTLERQFQKIPSFQKENARETINKIISSRTKIFENEYSAKFNSMESNMYNSAKKRAKSEHEICGFISETPFIKKKSYDNYSHNLKIVYRYAFRMKGGFLCGVEYSTIIEVVGSLYGNEDEGITHNISAHLVSDNEI